MLVSTQRAKPAFVGQSNWHTVYSRESFRSLSVQRPIVRISQSGFPVDVREILLFKSRSKPGTNVLFRIYVLTSCPEVIWHFPPSECAQAQDLHIYRQDSVAAEDLPTIEQLHGDDTSSHQQKASAPGLVIVGAWGRGAVVWL
jgi:hypothetical protein